MSLTDWWAEMTADRESRTRRERLGSSEITFLDEVPTHVIGCRLPDGSATDAVCLTQQVAMLDEVPRVWTRCLSGASVRRRGRLTLHPGVEPLFVDEMDAELEAPVTAAADVTDLERDLVRSDRVCGLVRSELFATRRSASRWWCVRPSEGCRSAELACPWARRSPTARSSRACSTCSGRLRHRRGLRRRSRRPIRRRRALASLAGRPKVWAAHHAG